MGLTAILGTKVGMTQVHDDKGVMHPVTVIQAGPCVVTQVKSKAGDDGYDAVQIAFGPMKAKRAGKPMRGHFKKAGAGPMRVVREIRLGQAAEVKAGETVTVSGFAEGVTFVDVVGTSKGKGFAGVMKRWNFGGQPASHGTERKHRSPGSISMGMDRGRGRGLRLGKKMSGQLGREQVTAKHNKLVRVDQERGLLLVQGSVPGANGDVVLVKASHTRKQG